MYYFLIQNKYHADNFYPVADELVKVGVHKSKIVFIHFDKIFKLNTTVGNGYKIIIPESSLTNSFYSLNSFHRIRFIIKKRNYLLSLLNFETENVIITGNDGAIQRLYINESRKKGGKSYLLLDGNLKKNQGYNFLLRKSIHNIFDYLGFSYLVPSIRGHTKVNKVYVMHNCIKHILKEEGVKNKIETVFFPRYKSLVNSYHEVVQKKNTKINILYITSAFKWHSATQEHKKQLIDIKELDIYLERNKSKVNGKVRIHPRENIADYYAINLKNTTFDNNINYIDSLIWADVIITTVSTMSYEANLIGKRVYLYNKNIKTNNTLLCMGESKTYIINNYDEINLEDRFVSIEKVVDMDKPLESLIKDIINL